MEKIIRIYGKDAQTLDGNSYVRFSYTKDGKEFFDVKFNRTCEQMPTSKGYWLVTVMSEDCDIRKGKNKNSNRVLWIRQIVNLKKDKEYEEFRNSIKQSEVNILLHDVRDDEVKSAKSEK